MLLLSSSSLPHYGLERFFHFAKQSGYGGVEITISSLNYDTQNHAYLKSLASRFDLPIKAFSLEDNAEDKEDLLQVFQHTVREFPGCTIILSPPKTLAFKYKTWLSDLIPRLAEKYGLVFCRRNTPSKNLLGVIPERTEGSIFSLKQAGNVCLDLTALAMANEEIMRSIAFLGENLKHVYLSNVRRGTPYALPQNGVLPVESLLTKLAQIRYAGDFTLKVNAKQLFEGDDEKVVQKLGDCRDFYTKYFEKIIETS